MIQFLAFALYLCFGVATLIIWPLMIIPGMPVRRKILLGILAFIVVVPGGLALYALVGVPPMGAL